jgi:hypothetical protein
MMRKLNAQTNALSRIGAAGAVEAAMSDPGMYFEVFCPLLQVSEYQINFSR